MEDLKNFTKSSRLLRAVFSMLAESSLEEVALLLSPSAPLPRLTAQIEKRLCFVLDLWDDLPADAREQFVVTPLAVTEASTLLGISHIPAAIKLIETEKAHWETVRVDLGANHQSQEESGIIDNALSVINTIEQKVIDSELARTSALVEVLAVTFTVMLVSMPTHSAPEARNAAVTSAASRLASRMLMVHSWEL